jgi:hypothetical protein
MFFLKVLAGNVTVLPQGVIKSWQICAEHDKDLSFITQSTWNNTTHTW